MNGENGEVEPRLPSELVEGEFFSLRLGGLEVVFSFCYGQISVFIPLAPPEGRGLNVLDVDCKDVVGVGAADLVFKSVRGSIEAQGV